MAWHISTWAHHINFTSSLTSASSILSSLLLDTRHKFNSFSVQDALIQLGAKYAPCMRKDKELQRLLDKERQEEAQTGCCIGTDQNGCIQTSQEQCKVGN